MSSRTFGLEIDDWNYSFSLHSESIGSVEPGSTALLSLPDSSGNQISEKSEIDDLDLDRMFPVVGPIDVKGAAVGDAIGLRIESIELADKSITWTRPGLGVLEHNKFHARSLDNNRLEIPWNTKGRPVHAERLPHIGSIGLVGQGRTNPRSISQTGGNIDSPNCKTGSTVWFPSKRKGGGFYLGDVHATIGVGEVCGTGAESAAAVRLTPLVDKGWCPEFPTLQDESGNWATFVSASTIEDAISTATRYCRDRLVRALGMDEMDAYLAAGLLMRFDVCQVVNPKVTIEVSMYGDANPLLGPIIDHTR